MSDKRPPNYKVCTQPQVVDESKELASSRHKIHIKNAQTVVTPVRHTKRLKSEEVSALEGGSGHGVNPETKKLTAIDMVWGGGWGWGGGSFSSNRIPMVSYTKHISG